MMRLEFNVVVTEGNYDTDLPGPSGFCCWCPPAHPETCLLRDITPTSPNRFGITDYWTGQDGFRTGCSSLIGRGGGE
ncbi:MAG: hypothetical protein KKD18_07210 [Nanoarchaeota archaeon]|nr:hypothetical protein [Nanoarchaeota archaeon]MBU0978181.1 hypothetical protein [Nanoarchaeota archaeon]